MKKKEWIFIGIVFLICVLSFWATRYFKKAGTYIKVESQDGKVILKAPLNKNAIYKLQGKKGKFFLEVVDGRYRAKDVDCPDKICEAVGWVSKDNYMPIVCLPNGLLVVLTNE